MPICLLVSLSVHFRKSNHGTLALLSLTTEKTDNISMSISKTSDSSKEHVCYSHLNASYISSERNNIESILVHLSSIIIHIYNCEENIDLIEKGS